MAPNLDVRNDRYARVDKLAGNRQGRDSSLTLIWSHRSADWSQGINASPSKLVHIGAGHKAACYSCLRCKPSTLCIPSMARDHEGAAHPRARGRDFRWFHHRSGAAQAVPAMPATRQRRSSCWCPSLPSQLPLADARLTLARPGGVRNNAGSQVVPTSSCSAASAMSCFFMSAIRSASSLLTASRTGVRMWALVMRPR
jgi:hypothetical protein